METRLVLNTGVEPPALLTESGPFPTGGPPSLPQEPPCDPPQHAGPSHGDRLPRGPPVLRSIRESEAELQERSSMPPSGPVTSLLRNSPPMAFPSPQALAARLQGRPTRAPPLLSSPPHLVLKMRLVGTSVTGTSPVCIGNADWGVTLNLGGEGAAPSPKPWRNEGAQGPGWRSRALWETRLCSGKGGSVPQRGSLRGCRQPRAEGPAPALS
uniref:Uncharacterized protein n=1 Tax=Rangifer tarandus platyrhynchus TaxID=3082113 RepID=A0ACB0F456_RANTA|nr:unnamed protein product [Rangifer tarandus platyrhynchus]